MQDKECENLLSKFGKQKKKKVLKAALQICSVLFAEQEYINVLKEQVCLREVEHVLGGTGKVAHLWELGCPDQWRSLGAMGIAWKCLEVVL